jgi:DNA mismatch repair protein MSH6
MSTPRNSQKKTPASSAKGQKSILGFFSKKAEDSSLPARPALDKSAVARISHNHPTPVPSSDPPELQSSPAPIVKDPSRNNKENGLITPITPKPATNGSSADQSADIDDSDDSPVRKVYLWLKEGIMYQTNISSRERRSITSNLTMRRS